MAGDPDIKGIILSASCRTFTISEAVEFQDMINKYSTHHSINWRSVKTGRIVNIG